MARNSLFPNWYALSQRYFGLPEGQQRKDFLKKFPQVKDYFDWNSAYKESHPEIQEYADIYRPPEYDYTFMKEFTQPLVKQLYQHYLNSTPLSTGAINELNRIWQANGQQGGDFDTFLEVVIRPMLMP